MSKCVNAEEYTKWSKYIEEDMSEVGVEIVKTKETEKSGIKYLNINVSDDEVKRNPDVVRLCADAGILEYVKPSGDAISREAVLDLCDSTDPEYKVVHFKEDVECLPSVRPQEPKTDVINKIRAEIIKMQTYKLFEYTEKLVALDEVLQIIDKYKAESEE